jgi:YggT family protein
MITLIKTAIYIFLNFLSYALLARAILSWFPLSPENPILRILWFITEPVLTPFRKLLDKTGINDRLPIPIDLSFLAAYFVIWLIMPIFA